MNVCMYLFKFGYSVLGIFHAYRRMGGRSDFKKAFRNNIMASKNGPQKDSCVTCSEALIKPHLSTRYDLKLK
jgi:hypothetical protein